MGFFDLFFWQNLVSNGIATLLGVLLGVLGALKLSDYQERRTELERKEKILKLLEEELTFNHAIVYDWWSPPGETVPDDAENSDLSLFLRDDVWRAFADGGELQWIKNPTLLSKLSIAYFQVGIIKGLSERFYTMTCMRSQLGRQDYVKHTTSELHKGTEAFLETIKSLNDDFSFKL